MRIINKKQFSLFFLIFSYFITGLFCSLQDFSTFLSSSTTDNISLELFDDFIVNDSHVFSSNIVFFGNLNILFVDNYDENRYNFGIFVITSQKTISFSNITFEIGFFEGNFTKNIFFMEEKAALTLKVKKINVFSFFLS